VAGYPDAARRAAAHVVVEDIESPHLDEADRHHVRSVLRLRDGETLSVTDGRGGWRLCRLRAGDDLDADGPPEMIPRREPPLCVAFAPVKGDRPDWAVQKLTELGVDRIVLMRTERSVVRWQGARAATHVSRLVSVARQAVMQSRGVWLPVVEGVVDFGDAVSSAGVVLAEPGGGPLSLNTPVVLVGPEGGWSDGEREAGDVPTVSLGPAVLRTETAAVAAGVLLSALRAGVVTAP
jgi:16S rRNA (uracil1498-N3)-methyltransferase